MSPSGAPSHPKCKIPEQVMWQPAGSDCWNDEEICYYFYLCFALETERKVNINQRTQRKQRLTTEQNLHMEHWDKPITIQTIQWLTGWDEVVDIKNHQCNVFSFASKYKFRRNTMASWWKVEEDKSLLELYQKMKSKQKLSTWTLKIPQTSLRIQSLN